VSGRRTNRSSSRPGITKLANGRYRARYRDASGQQHEKRFESFALADKWLKAQSAALVRHDHVAPRRAEMTFGEWAELSLAAMAHLKPKTLAGYRSILDSRLLPRWKSVKLGAITNADVAAWVASLRGEDLSASRVRQCYGLLSSMLDAAVRDHRLATNPCSGVKLPRVVSRPRRYLTHEEVDQLADACGPYRLLVLVLAYCGLRYGEATALRAKNVSLLRGRLHIVEAVVEVNGKCVFGSPKTHQHRDVVVPAFLREELTQHIAGKAPDDLVFDQDGEVLRNHRFRRKWFDRAASQAGLEGLVPHELRHTAASLAIGAGASVKAVQAMLGHATATLTLDLYGHLYPDELDAVAAQLDAARSAMRAPCGADVVALPSRPGAHTA
jgi:integrase